MRVDERLALAVRGDPRMALWAIYFIWGLFFCTVVLGFMVAVYFAFGLETTVYFVVGLAAAGVLFFGGYVLLGGVLARLIARLARIFFP